MTRLTARDFPQELLELYDFYAHGRITKREFLERAGQFTVGGLTAMALLKTLSPDYALAQQIAFTDPDIVASYVTIPRPRGMARCAPIWCARRVRVRRSRRRSVASSLCTKIAA